MEKYVLHCASCNHKVFTDGKAEVAGLVEVKTAPPPARANGVSREVTRPGKKYKCPQCGMVLKPYGLPAPAPVETPAPPAPDMDERAYRREKTRHPPKIEDFLREIDALPKKAN